MNIRRRLPALALFLFLVVAVFPQTEMAGRVSFEFINQNITDILYVFSTYADISIIADDTVSGTGSLQFNGTSFDQAFDAFLLANRLYVEKTADLWVVSRVMIRLLPNNTLVLDALDASPGQLLEKLSRRLNATIIHDILPTAKLSLHFETASLYEAAALVMKPFADYEVEDVEGYIQVRRLSGDGYDPGGSMLMGLILINEMDGMYEVEIAQARLGDILEELFLRGNREYASFARSDQMIERVKFSGKEFDKALDMILEQGNGEYKEIAGTYYIFPMQQAEIITARRNEGKSWRRFDLKHLGTAEIMPLLQSRFSGLQTIAQAERSYFLALTDDRDAGELEGYIREMDTLRRTEAIRLKYIKPEDLYQALPPSVKREELIDAGNGNTVFFIGTSERLEVFRKELEIIDRP